jgi:hypothetical protein
MEWHYSECYEVVYLQIKQYMLSCENVQVSSDIELLLDMYKRRAYMWNLKWMLCQNDLAYIVPM